MSDVYDLMVGLSLGEAISIIMERKILRDAMDQIIAVESLYQAKQIAAIAAGRVDAKTVRAP